MSTSTPIIIGGLYLRWSYGEYEVVTVAKDSCDPSRMLVISLAVENTRDAERGECIAVDIDDFEGEMFDNDTDMIKKNFRFICA